MITSNIYNELNDVYTLNEYPEVKNFWFYELCTPSHSFTRYIKTYLDDSLIFSFCCRDFLNQNLVDDILELLNKSYVYVASSGKNLCILDGFAQNSQNFTQLAVIDHRCHRTFENESLSLHQKTYEVFPIFRCEFSGHETPKEISYIRNHVIVTINWARTPQPKILARWYNEKMQAGRKKFYIEKLEQLIWTITNLDESDKSFVEFKNYRDELTHVILKDNEYVLSGSHLQESQIKIPIDKIIDWLSDFLLKVC